MEYLRNIYGISMGYVIFLEYLLLKSPSVGGIPTFAPCLALAGDDELPRGRADSHRAGQVHGDDADGRYKIWCQTADLRMFFI